jgi:hypothetical protein
MSITFIYTAGANQLYSSNLIGNITIDSYTLGAGADTTPPTISVIKPTNNTNTSNVINAETGFPGKPI